MQPNPSTPELSPDVQKILREPFPPEQIGNLPRITCKACRDSQFRVCQQHSKSSCKVCGNWITGAHLHLSYVGHAAVTDRLLRADPGWNWEPAYRSVDPQVLAAAAGSGNQDVVAQVIANAPAQLDGRGGMWIRMTVAGVTRLGYGVDDSRDDDHDKKLISDAIRNAAMRFGVALDLWSKEDLGAEEPASAPAAAAVQVVRRDWVAEARACTDLDSLLRMGRECSDAGDFVDATRAALIRRRKELEAPSTNGHSHAGS